MQNELDGEGVGSNESNWRRNGDSSKNVPELRRRLLSRNRIYVVPDDSRNGHGGKLVSGLNNTPSPYTCTTPTTRTRNSSNEEQLEKNEIRGFSAISSFCPSSPHPAERKQGSLKETTTTRTRKLIASAKQERASSSDSLDLWEGSSLFTGTVKRRPPGTGLVRALSLTNSSQSKNVKSPIQPPSSPPPPKQTTDTGREESPTGSEARSSSSVGQEPSQTLTTCPKEDSHTEKIMGNTFTRKSQVMGVVRGSSGNGTKNKNEHETTCCLLPKTPACPITNTTLTATATATTSFIKKVKNEKNHGLIQANAKVQVKAQIQIQDPPQHGEAEAKKEKVSLSILKTSSLSPIPIPNPKESVGGPMISHVSHSLSDASDANEIYSSTSFSTSTVDSSSGASLRSSSPDSLPPPPPLPFPLPVPVHTETFEFQPMPTTQTQTQTRRTSSCHREKTLGISHSQIECDNLVRRIGDSSYYFSSQDQDQDQYQNQRQSLVWSCTPNGNTHVVGENLASKNLPETNDEKCRVEHLYSHDDDDDDDQFTKSMSPSNQFNTSPPPPSPTSSAPPSSFPNLLQLSKSDSRIISCRKDISCIIPISPSFPEVENEQLDHPEQLDLSSLGPNGACRNHGYGSSRSSSSSSVGRIEDNPTKDNALFTRAQLDERGRGELQRQRLLRDEENGNVNDKNDDGNAKTETKFDNLIVSEDRLMTTSVNRPSAQEFRVSSFETEHLLAPSRSETQLDFSDAFEHDIHLKFPRTLAPPPPPTPPPQTVTVATILINSKRGHINYEKIYTDWANHYLDKARCKRHIQDLQVDVTDGVILSDVVEAVTNQKVPDVVRKPKNSSQMLDNIHACLVFLSGLGVCLEGITARDIRDGHLKSILSLFFQLSRYKQQQKQQDRDRHNLQKQSTEMQQTGIKTAGPKHAQDSSKLPPPFGKHGGNTSIPMPANASTPKKTAQEKGKSALGVGNGPHSYPSGNVKPTSGSSSRSTSPSAIPGAPQSFIPTPRTSIPSAPTSARSSLHEKHISNVKNNGSKSSARVQNNNSANSAHLISTNNVANTKNTSMLEKFKFFKDKDKGDKLKSSTGSKRTSSSSGFSSARSERSDSSISLSSENKGVLSDGNGKSRESISIIQQSSIVSPVTDQTRSQNLENTSTSTPRLAIKGFRQKIGKAIASKDSKGNHHSPKTSRKESASDFSSISRGSQQQIKTQTGKSEFSSNVSVAVVTKDAQIPQINYDSSSLVKKCEKERDRERSLKPETKLRTVRATMDTVTSTSGSDHVNNANSNPNGYNFLRQPKPASANSSSSTSRDSRNRFSGTGIPTRNSLIASTNILSNVNGNSNSRDDLPHNNPQIELIASTNNLNTSMSSMNGIGVSNGTGIPKPTAAVKGTTKLTAPKDDKQTSQIQNGSNCLQTQNVNLITKDGLNSSKSKGSHQVKPCNNKITSGPASILSSNVSNDSLCESQIDNVATNQSECVISDFSKDASITECSLTESPKVSSKMEMLSNGVSVAMVSPMPSVTSGSSSSSNVITSMSSFDSTLSQSNSNSSEASVILSKVKLANTDKSHNSETQDENSETVPKIPNKDNDNPNLSHAKAPCIFSVSSTPNSGSSISSSTNEDALNLNLVQSSPSVLVECEEDELLVNVTPMEPLLRNSPYGYIKSPPGGNTGFLSPKSPNSNHTQLSRIVHTEDGTNATRILNTLANRHTYNPYCDHVRLARGKQPTPPQRYNSSHYSSNAGDYDYPDIDNVNTSSAGYLSDGDLLITGNNGNRPNDGYLSESGASVYNRRAQLNLRPKEALRGISNKHGFITEDRSYTLTNGPDLLKVNGFSGRGSKGRFDDSSSLSSGISDLNEMPTDLTSSSVNSELSSPYASLQRTVDESPKKKELVDPQSIIYRVVGSRSGSSTRKQAGNYHLSNSDVNRYLQKNQLMRASPAPCEKKDCNGYLPVSTGNEFHHFQQQNVKSDVNGKVLIRDKHGYLAGSAQLNYCMNNGIQSGTPANPVSQSSQFPSSSGKRPDSKTMNNLESRKKGIMGVREEHFGKEMADRLVKEERDREHKDRHRSATGHSHNNQNGHKGSSNGSSDGKRSNSAKASPSSFGYIRRSNGSSSNGCSPASSPVAKYSGGPNGKVCSSGNGGRPEKELLTAEEYKAAQVSLLSRLDSKGNEVHPNSYGGQSIGSSSVTASPKTRTKVKISGGTQTTNDLHEMSRHNPHHHQAQPQQPYHTYQRQQQQHYQLQQHHSNNSDADYASSTCSRNSGSFSSQSQPGYKSLSLTTPTATQLSQSLRERILGSQSLPKAATSSADYAAILAAIQQQQQQIYGTPNASKERMSRYNKIMNDGSLSDTGGYSNYSEIQAFSNLTSTSSPYTWMRHSAGYASSITSAPNRLIGGGSMTEAESLESLSSNSSMAAQLRDVRSNSLTQGRISNHQQETSPSRSPRLNRSNSIRSTKSEKLYPSMLQRSEDVNQYYGSQNSAGVANVPTSPMHGTPNRLVGGGLGPYGSTPVSNHNVRLSMSPYSGFLAKIATKEDEINGSSLSLVSTASSIYSTQEEKQAYEIRKLKRELVEAQEKVQTLTNQLSTNAHVVAAFEQSLSNMTQRLQSLSVTAEQKDSELSELKHTIDLLRKQSIEAGLTVANLTSGTSRDGSPIGRQLSADSVSSINSISSACSGTSHSHASGPSSQVLMTPLGTPTHHGSNNIPDSPNSKKKQSKNKGWLRSSFTKAFSRTKVSKYPNGSPCELDGEDSLRRPSHLNGTYGDMMHLNGNCHPHQQIHKGRHMEDSAPASPVLLSPHGLHIHNSSHSNGCSSSSGSHSPRSNGHVKGSSSSSALCEDFGEDNKSVDELKKQLREKEMVLTDIRLEALTSAHQLESFKETVNKMRNEMVSLKQDNERLQRMVSTKSLNSSQTSLPMNSVESLDRRMSASEVPSPSSLELLLADGNEKDGKRIIVTAFLGCHGCYDRYVNATEEFPAAECFIGAISVSSKLKWEMLDSIVRRTFKDYVTRLDQGTNLGLNTDSIGCYTIGEVIRSKESPVPELLPCGYLVGDVNKIRVCLKGAVHNGALDALAFETLVPKSVLQRYVTLLSDHGRMILCGPSGTGKSYLARKLGEFIVARAGKDPCPEAIATFSADHKNSKELRQYLANLAEQCETGSADLPSVIILDNLHQVSSFGEVFNCFLHSKQNNSPIIIGTMSQSNNSTTANLQLHHNFRWVLFGNHMEPVKGFLSRYLHRRLVEVEIQNGVRNIELERVMLWIPKVWLHVNKFLETHNSSDVTIGPRLFLSCPTDVANSQVWFTDLWHYSVLPYMIEAVKEGIQLYGKKSTWEDPAQFLLQTYPWTESLSLTTGKSSLMSLRPEDVGYDIKSGSSGMGNKASKTDSNETDPLMNMLMRLQEAANYSGPQSNDSDSTSLDSHMSLEPKDYTANN